MTETRRVVINGCYGGFGLSSRGVEAYLARKGKQVWWFTNAKDASGHPDLHKKVPTDNPDYEFIAYSYTSPEATDDSYFYHRDIPRDDPDLVAVVEGLGKDAADKFAELAIVEIPADVEWYVEEYDGLEHVAEQHRTWS